MVSTELTVPIGASQRRVPRKSNRQPLKHTPANAAQMQQMKYERAGTTASLPGTVTHMPCLSAVVRVQALACANGCCAGQGMGCAAKYELHAHRSRPFSKIAASVAQQLNQLLALRRLMAVALRCCPHPPWLTALHPPYTRPTSALQKLYFLTNKPSPEGFPCISAKCAHLFFRSTWSD